MTERDYLSDGEIRLLLSATQSTRDKAILVLFLSTGIFLKELIDLDITSIDWETKTLAVEGSRKRSLPLNDEALSALQIWLNDRIKTPEPALFVTLRGLPKRLSERAVDHLIRNNVNAAGLERNINFQRLRSTFAIRLLTKTQTDRKTAAKILGIETEAVDRYIGIINNDASRPSATEKNADTPPDTEALDNRPFWQKWWQKHRPSAPPNAQPAPMIPNTFLGREQVLAEIKASVTQGLPILLTGPLGIGKTAILQHLQQGLPHALYIESPTPFKSMLIHLANTLTSNTLGEDPAKPPFNQRSTSATLFEAITNTTALNPPILLIDNLSRIKASDLDTFLKLFPHFTIIGATEKTDPRLKSLWWKFKVIALDPLDTETMTRLIAQRTQHLSITNYDLLETQLLGKANGNPLAIIELTAQLSGTQKVDEPMIRNLHHEAGIQYRDWTPALMVFWMALVAFRFIALGTHSFEGYILAGIGTSLFVGGKYFVKRLKT
jgi:energy-coupling factor transporter ATP-binding protein EcfA2